MVRKGGAGKSCFTERRIMKPLEKARQDLEKAKKKREKMGISENQISNAARMNTRQVTASSKSSVKTTAEKELELEKANALKANAKPGSMAAKANLVREFNERNNKKN